LIIFCIGIFDLSLAQELPPIENFSPDVYQAGNQNWMASQGPNQHIYIANNAGLLEFNGARWELHDSPNGTIIRSVKVINDFIYTGCYMEFGYWKKDEFGVLAYNSLIDKLQVPLIKDEHFWNILEFDDWVLFQSLDRIYLYNTNDESFNVISSKSTRAKIFHVGGSIYFQKFNEGLFKIENGKSELISESFIVRQNVLIGAFSIDNKVLFLTEKGEFYFFNENKFTRWDIEAENELTSKTVYCSSQLKDGSFLLGTISNGIIQLDRDGNLVRKINKEQGLNNNTVLSIFEDNDNNLWLGLDNGISLINLDSPFSVYNDAKGLLGDVYATKIHKNTLYIGTNQGLFYKPLNSIQDFKLIENTKGQVWCLKEIDNILFCGHNNGTYIIDQNTATQISDFAGTWDIKKIGIDERLLLQGNYGGLSLLEKIDNEWRFRNRIKGFDMSSRFFEFVDDTQILVNHELNGTFILNIDSEFNNVLSQKNEEAYGFGSSLVRYNNEILYTANSNKGVFKYNIENQEFVLDSILSSIFYKENNNILGTLVVDQISDKIWGFSNRNIICMSQGKFNEQPRALKIPVPSYFRRRLGVTGFENLSALDNELFLIGVSNGYVILDLNKIKTKEYDIKINSIHKEFRNTSLEKVSIIDSPEFNSNENNLNFYFSVPEFNSYTEVEYQYQLKGIYDQWSFWFRESNISFKNLPSGEYTFNIKARIGNTETNNIATYKFIIKKPWYFTNTIIALYVLIFIIVSFTVHRMYKRYYTIKHLRELKKNKRKLKIQSLKSEKELMKIRNDNLRQDIDSKTRELGSSTMNLIKKNEFLNSIKKELKNVENISNLKRVIKIIDENLNNTDDWDLFQEAFNSVDKDFLKKIKGQHSSLTSNDLRLCAYLRLNLSSKEIAPLLNISFKSVEVKRYRLRKKLDLPHESNLTDYILEV